MITSRNNRWLKDIRRLRTSKGRRRDPRLLLEGPHLIGEALDSGLELDAVLVTEAFADSPTGEALLARLERPPLVVESSLLDEAADADSPRGLIALAHPRASAIETTDGTYVDGTYVYVDGLQDPGNLGALARVAEGAGVKGLFLGQGTVSPQHPRALRGSAGSLLRIPYTVDATPEQAEQRLGSRASWFKLVTRDGLNLYELEPARGARILALGAEGQGLSAELDERAGHALSIPMDGQVESLNATVSAAIVLFEWRRRVS